MQRLCPRRQLCDGRLRTREQLGPDVLAMQPLRARNKPVRQHPRRCVRHARHTGPRQPTARVGLHPRHALGTGNRSGVGARTGQFRRRGDGGLPKTDELHGHGQPTHPRRGKPTASGGHGPSRGRASLGTAHHAALGFHTTEFNSTQNPADRPAQRTIHGPDGRRHTGHGPRVRLRHGRRPPEKAQAPQGRRRIHGSQRGGADAG